jgi:cell division initiation protein
MIDLTPLEVRQKKGDFRRGLRGYDPELVNDFLDLVADRMEELVKENLALRDSVESVREEVASYRQKEQALSQALMTAQKLGEDAREYATRESDMILREARAKADSMHDEAARQLMREEEALRQVRARRSQLVESFRRMLEREMSELTVIQETLDLDAGEARTGAGKAAGPGVGADVEGAAREGVSRRDVAEQAVAKPAVTEGLGDRSGDEGEGMDAAAEERSEGVLEEAYPPLEPTSAGGPGRKAGRAPVGGDGEASEDAGDERDDWLASLIEEEGEESSRP